MNHETETISFTVKLYAEIGGRGATFHTRLPGLYKACTPPRQITALTLQAIKNARRDKATGVFKYD